MSDPVTPTPAPVPAPNPAPAPAPAASLPEWVIALLVGGVVLQSIVLVLGVVIFWRSLPQPPAPDYDPAFVAVGKGYLPQLGTAYASAWEDGAKALDSGQPLSASLDAMAKSWAANRTAVFDKVVTPAFGKVVPESTKDADVTPAQRAALAKAWRGFAKGMSK